MDWRRLTFCDQLEVGLGVLVLAPSGGRLRCGDFRNQKLYVIRTFYVRLRGLPRSDRGLSCRHRRRRRGLIAITMIGSVSASGRLAIIGVQSTIASVLTTT